jgi:D-sedoheptulose 7-phosphate isomerase
LKAQWADYLAQNFDIQNSLDTSDLKAVENLISSTRTESKTIWVLGNGGSAATASHFVADLVKTTKQFSGNSHKTIALHELQSLQTAYANDVSYGSAFAETLRDLSSPGDLILIISVSGTSKNLVEARNVADELELKSACIVGQAGIGLKSRCDAGVVIPSFDYQVVENWHTILLHWFAKTL